MKSTISHQLFDIEHFLTDVNLDIRYATLDNFLGKAVYSQPKCFLHKDVVRAIIAVQSDLKVLNLELKIFDGYRPLHVQQLMWDEIQDERYVSNPAQNKGRHTRGTAVDVTLIDLQGNELEMPTAFDDFTPKAASNSMDATPEAIKNRTLLKNVMERHRLIQLPTEWWHFDLIGWNDNEKYPPLNLSFEELQSSH